MPEGDRVGSAYVDIHVNAAPGEAEMAAFKAKIDRDFAELGRKKAEAELKLKKVEFDKEIDEAKAKLDYFKKRRASATLDLAKKHFDEQVAVAEAELKALTSKKRTIQIDSRQVKAANDAERLLAKERALTERGALQGAKAERALSNERSNAVTSGIRERAMLAKLGAEYEKLRGRQIGLEKSSRRVFSPRSLAVAEGEARKLERVASEADYVKHKIESLGGSVAHLDPQFSRNSSFIDKWLSRLGDTTVRLGPISTSIKGLAAGLGLLGPLVFELGGGLTALAGTIGSGLAGAATVGAGALAGLATSAAGVGFIVGPMVGEFKEAHAAAEGLHKAILKYGKGSEQAATYQERLNNELHGVSPIAKEAFISYGSLKDRWRELTKAARPAVFTAFGEALKTVQSLLPTFARESTKTTQVASKAWDGWMKSLRSSEAKQLLGSIMSDFRASIPGLADGLGSLVAMMGRLSAAGAHFLPGLSNGFADWANNLERAVGGGQHLQSDVGNMVSQMRDLGHLTQDTGSLLVHVFSAGANSGQGMVKSLDQVIKRWDKWTQSTSGKEGMAEFFSDSKGATEDFMSSLTHMTKLLFEFSRATAPVANGLLKIVTWIGDIVSAADNLVGVKQVFQAIGLVLGGLFVASKVASYSDVIQGVLVRFGLMSAAADEDAASVSALTAAVTENTAALTAQSAAATEAAAALGADGIAADAAGAEAALGGVTAGAGEAGMAMGGAAEGAGLLGAALAPEVLIPAAAIAGLAVLVGGMGQAETAADSAQKAFRASGHAIPKAMQEMAAASVRYTLVQQHEKSASDEVAAARRRLLKLQRENAPTQQQTNAVVALNEAEKRHIAVQAEVGHQNAVTIKGAKAVLKVQKEHLASSQRALKIGREEKAAAVRAREAGFNGERPEDRAHALERLRGTAFGVARAEEEIAKARAKIAQATRQATVAGIPLERQLEHLRAITPETERGLHKLVETIGSAAAHKIGNFVDPKDVQRVTNLGNQLTKLGRGGQVKDIAVKSQGADQTINKLQRLQRQTKNVEGARANIKVGANDTQAQSKLKRLAALSQRVTGSRNTISILANSSSAEQAIQSLRHHLEAVAHRKYEATVSAVDKTQPGWESAYHHLREAASKKYEARISAIDNASSVAKKAEAAAKGVGRQHPRVNITASASGALSAIDSVRNELESLNGKTATTYVRTVHPKSGGFSGGPSINFYSTFAQGGLSDRELQRANERAVRKEAGPSQKVNRPTMLVGEQAPSHPEYVIATNPAYRASNERYLSDAAGDLGYEVVPAHRDRGRRVRVRDVYHEREVVPAYKQGKGKDKHADGKQAPFRHQHKPHYTRKARKFLNQPGATAVNELNATEQQIQNVEGEFNAELSREEQEITHKKRTEYDFTVLRGFLNQEAGKEQHIRHDLIPAIRVASDQAIGRASKLLGSSLSASAVKAAQKSANAIEREVSGLHDPTKPSKGTHESEADYKKKLGDYHDSKKHYNKEKAKKEREAKAAKKYAKRLSEERAAALQIRTEAQEQLNELRQEVLAEHATKAKEIETEQINYAEMEANPEFTPYFSSEGGAGSSSTPSYAEQTSTLSMEREKLYNEYGSNVAGYGGAGAGTHAPTSRDSSAAAPHEGSPRTQGAIAFHEDGASARPRSGAAAALGLVGTASHIAPAVLGYAGQGALDAHEGAMRQQAAATTGPGGYVTAATQPPGMPTNLLSQGGGGAGSVGTVNNVTNNFAAPPPDAHTWAKQQKFELGAIAG